MCLPIQPLFQTHKRANHNLTLTNAITLQNRALKLALLATFIAAYAKTYMVLSSCFQRATLLLLSDPDC